MDMRCSVNMQSHSEHQTYQIEKRLEEVFEHYRVLLVDRERFLETPEVQQVLVIMKSVNISVDDIADYLGEDFAREWKRGGGDE